MNDKNTYQGNIKSFFTIIREELPDYDAVRVIHRILKEYPDIKNEKKCPNCEASMMAYWYLFDVLDVIALIRIGNAITHKFRNSQITFTEANKIHIQSLDTLTYAMKSRTTQMKELGLLAKDEVNGRQVRGSWVITKRGWKALRNEPVPKKVKVFRNKIIDRSEEEITLSEAIKVNADKIRAKHLETDYEPEYFYGVEPGDGKIFKANDIKLF